PHNPPLHQLSFHLNQNQSLPILPHNPSPKSTLPPLLNPLILPHPPTLKLPHIHLKQQTLSHIPKNLRILFQNPHNQFLPSTLPHHLTFPLQNNRLHRQFIIHPLHSPLKHVNIQQFLDQHPHHLSRPQNH
ncbi:ATP-binding cassette domain-containing protein, partial [Bacillus altitudinis]|uniref:ATP-binding cassette domain-containing protein n=1 Tax=Bacillus altitudinis TaxID=293387 RepID=UPI0011A3EBB7